MLMIEMERNKEKFYKIRKYLGGGHNSVERDKKAFLDYELGKITLDICLRRFYVNNPFPQNERNVDIDEFKEWLESLGWKQINRN